MDFVEIGNPGNSADTEGYGSVAYTYNLGKYEVSREQIDKANSAGGLGIRMLDMSSFGGNGVNRPATGIGWFEAAKYVNWLNTSTGNTAAYKFDGSGAFQLWAEGDAGYSANNLFRNSLAKYVIVSMNEWYKGAYGKADGSWSSYPNGGYFLPTPVGSGTAANTAVFSQSMYTGPADITSAGGLSAYGTMGQGGNVWDMIETANDGTNDTAGEDRGVRGGSWTENSHYLAASTTRFRVDPSTEGSYDVGFRVAMIPEPSSLSLLVLGGVVVALGRRKRA